MKGLTSIRLFTLCVCLGVPGIAAARAKTTAAIAFNAGAPRQVRLTDQRTGKSYLVALKPELDVHGAVVAIDLVVTAPDDDERNLLAPFGIYHGLQPYDFVALDFRRGVANSAFGRMRVLPIRSNSTKLVVSLEDVQVQEVAGTPRSDVGSVEIISLRATVSLKGDRQPSRSD